MTLSTVFNKDSKEYNFCKELLKLERKSEIICDEIVFKRNAIEKIALVIFKTETPLYKRYCMPSFDYPEGYYTCDSNDGNFTRVPAGIGGECMLAQFYNLIHMCILVVKRKLQYSMKLSDWQLIKQFINSISEQQLIQESIIKTNLSPTNINNPSNETKQYRSGCYLIQRQNDSIYKRVKIGKGKDVLKRINNEMAYKNCVVISINHVDLNKLSECENEIIQQFTEKFKLIKDSDEGNTGNETFEIDNLFETKKLFDSICEKYFA